MVYQMSANELRKFGAAWHEQGIKAAEEAERVVEKDRPPGQSDQVAALLTLQSAVDGLVGAVLTVGAAICERIEEKSAIQLVN